MFTQEPIFTAKFELSKTRNVALRIRMSSDSEGILEIYSESPAILKENKQEQQDLRPNDEDEDWEDIPF